MQIETCPHCHIRVIPSGNGICPSCRCSVYEATAESPAPKGRPEETQAKVLNLSEHFHPLRDVGEWPRVVLGWVIAAFAVLFGLPVAFCPIAVVVLALQRDWDVAAGVGMSMLMCGLFFAAPLFWLARRLLRGKRGANGVTVLPFWLMQVMGVFIILGAAVFAYQALSDPNLKMGLKFVAQYVGFSALIGVGMFIVPWLVKRQMNSRLNEEDVQPAAVADKAANESPTDRS